MYLGENYETIGDFNFQGTSTKKTWQSETFRNYISTQTKFRGIYNIFCERTGKNINVLRRLFNIIAPYWLRVILTHSLSSDLVVTHPFSCLVLKEQMK